jgi:hypothetical protein
MTEAAIEPEFIGFPKMARLSREMIITEKIDGTNAQIYIAENGIDFRAGSRTQWITPDKDNHGFARWVYDNIDQLSKLGPGRHIGEFWGSGVQRGYGLPKGEKRFSMFNVVRWALHGTEPKQIVTGDPTQIKMQDVLPACVGLVPTLYRGMFDMDQIEDELANLKMFGSVASPGFMKPEGIVVFHTAANFGFKKTIEKDEMPKTLAERKVK